MNLLKSPTLSRNLLQIICWFITNLSKEREYNKDNFMKALFVFQGGLFLNEDEEIVSDCLWGLSYLTSSQEDEVIKIVASGESLPRIIEHLDTSKGATIYVPALRTIAQLMVTDDEYIIDKAIFEGLIGKLL